MEASSGRLVTFYSYKGGTGRSMALANFAWILAASGKKVLVIDWDLEAPGLHRYFRPFLVDPDLFGTDGLIDSLWDFATSSIPQTTSTQPSTDPKKDEIAAQALDENKRRLNWKFAPPGYIDFICAGKQDASYSQRVNTFDWKRFYELGGPRLISLAKAHMRSRYDWVLIDSRTGVSDTSGISTMEMPDTVVACFTLNRQSIEGVRGILGSIRDFKSSTVDGSKITFYPLATRIENAEKDKLQTARGYARSQLADFLPGMYKDRQRDYWDKMEFAYRPSYAFEEVLAAFGDATGATGASDTMLAQVEKTAQCITGDEKLQMPEILDQDRETVLAKYSFVGTASKPSQSIKESEEISDASDPEFLRGVLAKEQIWRASGFNWRSLLSPRELELVLPEDRKNFGRNMTYYYGQSQKMQQLLRSFRSRFRWALLPSLLVGFLASFLLAPFQYRDTFESVIGVPWGSWQLYFQKNPLWIILTTILYGAIALTFIYGILVLTASSEERPYGVITRDLPFIFGPLRRQILDYDPNE